MPEPEFPIGGLPPIGADGVSRLMHALRGTLTRQGSQELPPATYPNDPSITTVGIWQMIQSQEIGYATHQLATRQDALDLRFNHDIESGFIPDANKFIGFPQQRAPLSAFGVPISQRVAEDLARTDPLAYARDPRASHNRAVETLFRVLQHPETIQSFGASQANSVALSRLASRFIPGLRQAQPWVGSLFGIEQSDLRDDLPSIEALAVDRAVHALGVTIGGDDSRILETLQLVRDNLTRAPQGGGGAGALLGETLEAFIDVADVSAGFFRDPAGSASAFIESDISGTETGFSGMFEFAKQTADLPTPLRVGNFDVGREAARLIDPTLFLPIVGWGKPLGSSAIRLARAQRLYSRPRIAASGAVNLQDGFTIGRALGMSDQDIVMFIRPIGGAADLEDPLQLIRTANTLDSAVDASYRASLVGTTTRARSTTIFGPTVRSVDDVLQERNFLDAYFRAVTGVAGDPREIIRVGTAQRSAQSSLFASGDDVALVAIRNAVADRLEAEFPHLAEVKPRLPQSGDDTIAEAVRGGNYIPADQPIITGPTPEQAQAAFAVDRATVAIHSILEEMRWGATRVAGGALGDVAGQVEALATAAGRVIHPEVLRLLDLTDRGLPRMFPDAALEKIGQLPIARQAIELWTYAPLTDRTVRMTQVASADYLRAEVLRAEQRVLNWIGRAKKEFGGLDDALLADPLPGTDHILQGKLVDVIENPQLYNLTDGQRALVDDMQRTFANDLELLRALGADWGEVATNYIPHLYTSKISQQLQKGGGGRTLGVHANMSKTRKYPTLREAVDADPKLAKEIITDSDVLIRARLLSGAKVRADIVASEPLKSLGRTVKDDVFFAPVSAERFPTLNGFFFEPKVADDIMRTFRSDMDIPILGAVFVGIDNLRQTVLSLDGSFMSIQGLLGFMVNPKASLRSLPSAVAAFSSTAYWSHWLDANGEFLAWAAERGFKVTLPKVNDEFSADFFARIGRSRIPVVNKGASAVWQLNQRGFGRAITIQKAAMLRKNLEVVGYAADNNIPHFVDGTRRISRNQDPEFLARDAIRNINLTIPAVNFEELALSSFRQRLERVPFISPSYWRSPQMLAKDLLDFKSPRGRLARMAAVNAVIMGQTMAITITVASGHGDQIGNILNPLHRDFMTGFTPWGKVRFGGPFRSQWRMVSPTDDVDKFFAGAFEKVGYRLNPPVSATRDLLSNEDFFGRRIRTEEGFINQFFQSIQYFGIQSMPLGLAAIDESFQDGLDTETFMVNLAFQFGGASFSPFSPFFETDVKLREEIAAGIVPSNILGREITSYNDLPGKFRDEFDQRNPDLAQAKLESGTSEFAESRRGKDAILQETITGVRSHLGDYLDTASGDPNVTITNSRDLASLIGDELSALAQRQVQVDLTLGIDHEANLESEDPLERAVAEYYHAILSTAERGASIDATVADRELARIEATWTTEQAQWVELSTGNNRRKIANAVPAAGIYFDMRTLAINSGILELDDQIWEGLQQQRPDLSDIPTFGDYLFRLAQTIANQSGESLQALLSAGVGHSAINSDGIVSYVLGERKRFQEPFLRDNPQLMGALLALGWRSQFSQGLQPIAAAAMQTWIDRIRAAGLERDPDAEEPTLGNVGTQAHGREVIRLRADGLTHQAIAEATGASVESVEQALRRNRRRLGLAPSGTT